LHVLLGFVRRIDDNGDADLTKCSNDWSVRHSSLNITQLPRTRILLPNDIDSVPDMPFLILLSDFEYVGLQIPNVLRTHMKLIKISDVARVP